MAGRLAALPAAEAAEVCGRWLERVAAEARPALGRLLRGCTAAAALSGAEEALQAAIGAWRHMTPVEEPISGDMPGPDPSEATPYTGQWFWKQIDIWKQHPCVEPSLSPLSAELLQLYTCLE